MLDPKVDVVFKLLMARADNAPLLRSMIEAVVELPAPIEALTVLNPEIPRALAAHKTVVLDLHVRCADGTLLDVEMETQPRPVLPQRVLFYWSGLYGGQLARGENYQRLRRTISIAWLNGTLPVLDDRFHSTFHIREDETGRVLTDHLELHLLALPKLYGPQEVDPRLSRWARFFLAGDVESLHALAVEDRTMSKAVDELERLSRDPETQRMLENLERDRLFHGHELAVEREEGVEEGLGIGLSRGRDQRSLEIARNLLDAGVAPSEAARLTELSPEALAELLASRA